MADSDLSHIKPSARKATPLPFPPAMSTYVKGKIVTRAELAAYDAAVRAWWTQVQTAQSLNTS